MFSKDSPGCSVCVLQNEKIILKKCFGLADLKNGTKIKPNTAFRLASLTKQFTARAITILEEKGKLDFDDQLRKFFPDFPAYGKNISVRNLLTHTSGIPDHETPLYKKIRIGEEPTIYDSLKVIEERKRLLFKPGSKHKYSDSGYVLLALIIEKASGLKYSQFLKKYIFRSLGMDRTIVVDETKPSVKNRAFGYRMLNKKWELYDYDPLNYIVGDEGIYSTVTDLAKWNRLLNKTDWISNFCGLVDKKIKVRYQTGSWVGFNNIILSDMKKNITIIMLSNTTIFKEENKKIDIALKILNEYSLAL